MISARMPNGILQRLSEYTEDTGRTRTETVAYALDEYLSKRGYEGTTGRPTTLLAQLTGWLWRSAFVGAAVAFVVEWALGMDGHLFGFILFLVGLASLSIWDAEPRVSTALEVSWQRIAAWNGGERA